MSPAIEDEAAPHMRRAILLAVALVGCQSSRPDPAAVVERFYATTTASRVSGAPTPEQLAALAPYISDSLRGLLAAARRRHDVDMARSPDDKPSFTEGDLFSSLFEGPTTVRVAADTLRGSSHAVTVRMTHRGADPAITWSDVAIVTAEHGRWVIDDIEYGGTWDFAPRGSLRAQLASGLGAE